MVDHQKAKVCVENKTGKALREVGVVHKYSDDYTNKKNWQNIAPGEKTSPSLKVEYHTGFLTTGRDWWVVTWQYEGDNKLYFTDPQNMRGFLDKLETTTIKGIELGLSIAASKAVDEVKSATASLDIPDELKKTVKEDAPELVKEGIESAGKVFTDALFNRASTEGFKQHILREEDANKLTKIIIHENNTVEFKSSSGTSETGSSYHEAPNKASDKVSDEAPTTSGKKSSTKSSKKKSATSSKK